MKRYIVLFAILITAIFFYPVFAHADKIGYFLTKNPVSEPVIFFVFGSGLLVLGGLMRRFIKN